MMNTPWSPEVASRYTNAGLVLEAERRSWLSLAAARVEGIAEAAALAWALGLALYTSAYFALYLGGVSTAGAVAPAIVVAGIGLIAGGIMLRAGRHEESYGTGSGTLPIVTVGLGIAAIQAAIAVSMATQSKLRFWDAWFVWAVKAHMFAAAGPPPGYFTGALGPVAHPDYPLNMVLAEALFFRLPDPLGTLLASLVSPACLAALLILFYVGSTRLYGRDRAALATGVLALVPSLPRWAGVGYADPPLALYLGASAVYLLLWWRFRRVADLVLLGLFAGGAIWTKKEGAPVAALLLAALVVGEICAHDTILRRFRYALTGIVPSLLLPLPWLIFTRTVRPLGTDFWPITPTVFRAHADRLPRIFSSVWHELLTFSHWSVFWVAVGVVIVVIGLYGLPWPGRALLVLLLAQLGIYAVSFVFSYWTPYTAHIATALDRLIVHAVPWAALLLLEATQALISARPSTMRELASRFTPDRVAVFGK